MSLVCRSCGRNYDLSAWHLKCKCGGVLDIQGELEWKPRGRGVWRYRSMIRVCKKRIISLGEGATPLSRRNGVYFKLDYLNPTGSFKDRGASTLVSHLACLGVRKIVEDSSGNAGLAIATYARAAGMEALVMVPHYTSPGKKRLISKVGLLVEVHGSREIVADVASSMIGRVYASHLWSPFFIEGLRTLAFEIYEEIGVPDDIIVPVGSGGLLLGMYNGFIDLLNIGVISEVPRIHAVQYVKSAPLYRELIDPGFMDETGGPVLAEGIMVKRPPRLGQVVDAVKRSGGTVVLVNDSDIREALKAAVSWGFIVEPTAAAAIAGLWKMGEIGEKTVVVLTGSGLKE